MKYLKPYAVYEKFDDIKDIEEDFYDIFLSMKDISPVQLSIRQAPSVFVQPNPTYIFSVSIGLDNHVVRIADQINSKYGHKYRPAINGNEIITELADAVLRCVDLGLVISNAQVTWVNAGEWLLKYPGNSNPGPGILSKTFSYNDEKRAETFPIEGVTKGHYPPEMLSDFLIEKGDRVRMVRINFEYTKSI